VSRDELGNIGYVRRLWKAFEKGGVSAMAELVPPDVSWRPVEAKGHILRGTQELSDFWSSYGDYVMPRLRMFQGHGDDVLVEAEYPRDDGSVLTVWLLYRFDGDRLVEAIGFADEEQARSYSSVPPASG
jgi:hypothetical protein